MSWLWCILLVLLLIVGWLLTLLGLPGNWLMVVAVTIYVFLVPREERIAVSWPVPVVAGLLATLGEVLEFVAGAAGVAQAGGSKRSAVLALAGSLIGQAGRRFGDCPYGGCRADRSIAGMTESSA
jgi:hypothetical protein